MIRSMTGFGRGETLSDGYRFRVEIKSVNHRFLNTNIRLPREFGHHESLLAAQCAERCERGHLSLKVEIEPESGADGRGPRLNREVLDRFLEIVDGLEGLWSVRGGISSEGLLALPGVIEWDPEAVDLSDETFVKGATQALSAALDELVASREHEGRSLEKDFRQRLGALEERRSHLAELAPAREERERERLRTKVADLLEGAGDGLDQRIATEVVMLADRVDISEELTRMRAHLDHFSVELDGDTGAVGRKLTFLIQELNREANTIGSKANDPEMQRSAIEIKSELEKMREQAENVE